MPHSTSADERTTSAQLPWASGLDDVEFAHTALSDVQGERGTLSIAGSAVEDLAGRVSFEGLAERLLRAGAHSTTAMLDVSLLAQARVRVAHQLHPRWPTTAHLSDPMDRLRALLAGLSGDALDAIAGTAVATAWIAAAVRGVDRPMPNATLAHAADLQLMATGDSDSLRARALESYLVTIMDHGMNASTFAARVVASTGSDVVSAVVAGIGALKGPLHGGAPGPVLDMLDAIASPERADGWVCAELDAGRRLMGFGHRIYRVRDPRAVVLERVARELVESLPSDGVPHTRERLALARVVETQATARLRERHPDRPLAANVEFFTAIVLEACGWPRSLFSPLFASGRVVGWCAHVQEQRRVGRLIRPRSTYVSQSAAGA